MQVETDVYDAFGFDDDDDLLLAAVQKAEQEAQARLTATTPIQIPSTEDDEDEFDDLPDEALNLAAEYAEKYSSTTTVSNVTITGDGRLTDYFATTSSSSRTTSTTRNHPPPVNAPPPPQQHNALASTSAESSRAPFTIGGDIEELENPTPPPPPPVGTPCFHPYDREALPTWVYPINYPIRLYQYNIVQKCLFSNTLVALPTGLGKTFIAAVVMYNYWRWFPQSKIIFLAPSKPLVTQQIEACFKICGLPQSDTVEMTGSVKAEQRSVYWTSKRVFFLTPQTLQNDLESRRCPAEKIACIVFDEAHKATGNHSYAVIMRHILRRNTQFRVLALTATPGTKLESVQAVISSLCIASAQVRTEDSMDVQQYIHSKNIQRNVVKLDYTAGASGPVPLLANRFRREFFDPVLKELHRYHAIQSVDPENNSPYMLLQYQRFFSQNARNFNAAMKGKIYSLFTAAQAYSRAYDMLCQHGIGAFAQSLDAEMKNIQSSIANGEKVPNNKLKTFNNPHLKRLVEDVQRQQQDPGFIGHPKIETLLSVILQHLTNAPATGTRIMVFSTYRISVDEIVKVLSQHEPLIRCSIFVGQAGGKNGTKGLNQREQQEIITKFKNGELNVLVATSIGEEGLDIGEVDLIICYDAQTSPVRMLQRMGRTGRQRQGHCVMLMTESEEKKFRRARESYTRIQQIVTKGSSTLPFYKEDPSVLPERYRPVCRKERLTIGTFMRPSTGRKRGKGSAKIVNSDGTLTEDVAQEFLASFGDSNGLLYEDMQAVFDAYYPKDDVRERALKYLPRNTRLGPTHRVGHSQRTVRFVNHIAKMEKRILNDGCSDAGSSVSGILPSDTTEQLLLPRRTRPAPEIPENPVVSPTAPETLLIPGRLRRRLQARKERQEQLEEEQHHQTQRNRTEVSLLSQPRSPSPVATVPSKSPQRLSLESLENILDIDSALQDAVDFSAATQEESPGEEQSLVSNEGKGEGEDGAQDNENAVSLASSISLVDLDEYIRANGGEDVLRMLEDEQPEMTHEAQFPVTNVMHSPIQRNDRFDYDDYIMPVYPYEKKIARPKHSAFPIASFMTSLPKFNAVAEKMVEERELRIAGRSADSTRRILDMFNDLSQQRQSTPTFEDDFDPDALDALLKASEDTSQTIPDESASETIPANNSVNSNKHISANDEKMREISAMSSQKHASDINHVYTKQETNRQLYHEDVHSSHEQQNWRQYVNSQYEANCEQLGTATEREIQARAEIYGNDEEEVIELDLSFLENNIGDQQDFTIGEENASPILPPSSPPIVDGGSPSRPIHLSQSSPQSPASPRRHSSNDPRSSSPFRPQFRNTNAPKTDFTDLMSQPVTAPARLRRARRTFDEMKSGDEEEGGKESENEDEMPVRKRRRNMHTSRNPFLDLEAEEGTDDEEMTQPKRRGNSREEDEDDEGDEREDLDRSSIMDSFIYDGSSELAPEQQGSSELAAPANPAKHFDIYRTSLLAPEVLQSRGITPVFNGNNCNGRKSWLDKVRTDMWMQAAEEDDVEVAVDEEEDEEEEADDSRMAYTSEIKEFNSDSDFASG